MSWENNSPIRMRLGTIAIWNRLTKRTVDLRDGVLQKLAESAPEMYKDLAESPRPIAMGDAQ